jgi:hypothetical protein
MLVLDLICRPRGIARVCRPTPATIPLLALSVLCMAVAVSTRITFGPWTIATIELPNFLKALMAAIHCPGRLFWPVHYLVILLVIVVTYRQWRSPTRELLLVGALILQFADLLPLRDHVRAEYDRQPRRPLTSPVWRELGASHEQLIVLPAWQCTPDTPGGPEGFRIFGELAVAQGLRTNSYYAARYSREQVRVHCHTPPPAGEDLDPRAAYVVSGKIVSAWNRSMMTSHVCEVVDGFNLCTRNRPGASSSSAALETRIRTLIPAYDLGQTLTFGIDGTGTRFMSTGWMEGDPLYSDSIGTWTSVSRSSLVIPLGTTLSSGLRLVATARALVTEQHPDLAVFVVVNGHNLGRWVFTSWINASIPWEAADTGEFEIPEVVVSKSPVLNIQFLIPDPRSPSALNLSGDTRSLGVHLRTLRIAKAGDLRK